jgi:hypothetical protein
MLEFLKGWSFLPSAEGKTVFASVSEKRRWFERGSVEVNGRKSSPEDPAPEPTDSVVLHPKGKKRTTLQ